MEETIAVDLFIVNTPKVTHDIVIHLDYPGYRMTSEKNMGSKHVFIPVEFPLVLDHFPGGKTQHEWGKETNILYDFVSDFINRRKDKKIAIFNETHHIRAPFQMIFVCLLQRMKGNEVATHEIYKLFTQDKSTFYINYLFKAFVLPPLIRKYRQL